MQVYAVCAYSGFCYTADTLLPSDLRIITLRWVLFTNIYNIHQEQGEYKGQILIDPDFIVKYYLLLSVRDSGTVSACARKHSGG